MTREQFITGKEFKLGSAFFKLNLDQQSILRIYKSTDETRDVMIDYHANVSKIGRVGFEAFVFILGKQVVRKIKFADLELFKG